MNRTNCDMLDIDNMITPYKLPIIEPSMIPLIIKVSVDGESKHTDTTSEIGPLLLTYDHNEIKLPVGNSIHKRLISNREIIDTLLGKTIVNGVIRNLQKKVSSIIPTVINNICHQSYCEPNKYVLFAFQMYSKMSAATKKDKLSRKLFEIINKHNEGDTNEKLYDMCYELVRAGLIELMSYKVGLERLVLMEKSKNLQLFMISQ
eukprot:842298_1